MMKTDWAIKQGDQVLLNWKEYRRWYHAVCNLRNWRIQEQEDADAVATVNNVFNHKVHKEEVAYISVGCFAFNCPTRFLHKVFSDKEST